MWGQTRLLLRSLVVMQHILLTYRTIPNVMVTENEKQWLGPVHSESWWNDIFWLCTFSEHLLSVHMGVLCLFCPILLVLWAFGTLVWWHLCFRKRVMQLEYENSIFFTYFHCSSLPPQVSFAAHIAGGFAGMSIGYTVFSCFDKALLKDPRFWMAIAAYFACVLFAVFFNIFLSPANWPASHAYSHTQIEKHFFLTNLWSIFLNMLK